MKLIRLRNIPTPYIFIALILVLTIIGCGGGGGGGSSERVVNEFSESSSGDPSGDPTGDPSGDPTGDPTGDPSGDPSGDPTGDPSGDPSGDPTTDTSVILSWDEPTTNSDGSQLTDLAGYKVYYGTSSHNYSYSIDIGVTTGAAISSLSLETWCFAVTAYDTSGNESDYSDEVCI
jgi:hypothetical protein